MGRPRSAARYHRLQLVLSAIALAVGAAWLVTMSVTPVARLVASAASRVLDRWWWTVAAVTVATGLGHALLTAPLDVARGFVLPRRFGLLRQPFVAWIVDQLKGAALGGAVGVALVEIVYAVIGATPLWWLVAGGSVMLLALLGAVIFPVWIVPLFYRLTPLADVALRERLVALADRAGVPVVGVFVVDHSRKSRTVNAALAGLGRTRRIILFDTLIDALGADEIEAVLAHELGHHAHHDMWRALALQTVVGFVTFWIADRLLRASVGMLGLRGLDDPAGVPWLVLVLGALGLVAVPLVNFLSRHAERRADDFALAVTRDAGAFIGAMERLADLNLAERNPARVKEILLYSHPAVERRIARARQYATMTSG